MGKIDLNKVKGCRIVRFKELKQVVKDIESEAYDDTEIRQMIADTNANFDNYYNKSLSYDKNQIDTMMETQRQGLYVLVDELPEASEDTMFKIYLVPSEDASQGNVKDEYITLLNDDTFSWEKIGSTAIDLSNYSTTDEMNEAIVTALEPYYQKPSTGIPIRDLSIEAQSGLLDGSDAYDYMMGDLQDELANKVEIVITTTLPTPSQEYSNKLYLVLNQGQGMSNNDYSEYICVQREITTPGKGGENTTTTVWVWEKVGLSNTEITNMLSYKVDKEIGKGLSTNDYTNEDKSKVDNIIYATQQDVINLFK